MMIVFINDEVLEYISFVDGGNGKSVREGIDENNLLVQYAGAVRDFHPKW